jgi:myo-inositol 2-dehydrogenase/D-chiro-inositol 1-dehydrogenase
MSGKWQASIYLPGPSVVSSTFRPKDPTDEERRMIEQQGAGSTRRDFIRSAAAAAMATTVVSGLDRLVGAHAAGSDEIRVGLVGCGGRGTGAAGNVLKAAPGVRIVALADAFRDRLDQCRDALAKEHPDTATVAQDHCFVGLDSYQQLLKTDVNYVILASPPGFRPVHIKAAIDAGKNIFAEKPVAVDAAGVRACISMADEITKRGLAMVAGTQYRHFDPYIQAMQRLHDGAIGKVTAARAYYNTSELWHHERQPDWTDLENQIRNWLYYTWLSGDHIVEQFVHNIDAMNWAFQGHPIRALATGGRQVRTAPEFGHIYDHFAVVYEYPDGVFCTAMCRQQNGTDKKVANEFTGTNGSALVLPNYVISGPNAWKYEGEPNDMYVHEHTDLIASIRGGKPVNELKQVAETTLTAVMGRMSAYSGKALTWDDAMNSEESLMPEKLTWGPMPTPHVALPGQTTM